MENSKPTVGRIVCYRVTPDEHERATGYEPGGDSIIEWPAIIVAVHDDTCEWHWPPRG